MEKTAFAVITGAYLGAHNWILRYAEELPEAQILWKSSPRTLPIVFFLWHLGRWADHLQAAIPGMTPELSRRLPPGRQVWERDDYAMRWRFASAATGYAETGMEMDEDVAAALSFPGKAEVLNYVRTAFEAAERAIHAVDEAQFMALEQPQPFTKGIWSEGGSVGEAIMSHHSHDMLHIGMIQYLVGLQKSSVTSSS